MWTYLHEYAERRGINVRVVDLPEDAGSGLLWQWRGSMYALISSRLDRPAQTVVLAHELAHFERGGGADYPGMSSLWNARVARDEAETHRDAANMLVPVADLAAFCDRMADLGEGVGPAEVMAEFDCTRRVAEDALDNLTRHERRYRENP